MHYVTVSHLVFQSELSFQLLIGLILV